MQKIELFGNISRIMGTQGLHRPHNIISYLDSFYRSRYSSELFSLAIHINLPSKVSGFGRVLRIFADKVRQKHSKTSWQMIEDILFALETTNTPMHNTIVLVGRISLLCCTTLHQHLAFITCLLLQISVSRFTTCFLLARLTLYRLTGDTIMACTFALTKRKGGVVEYE